MPTITIIIMTWPKAADTHFSVSQKEEDWIILASAVGCAAHTKSYVSQWQSL